MGRRTEKADQEFRVEIEPSPVPDAAQRFKRAIALALQAALRGDGDTPDDIAQPRKTSGSGDQTPLAP